MDLADCSDHPVPPTNSSPFEHQRLRLDILVESLRRARKSALRVDTVKKLHRDVEHYNICGRLDQALRRVRVAAYDLVGPVAS
jgi:hypothetical protein